MKLQPAGNFAVRKPWFQDGSYILHLLCDSGLLPASALTPAGDKSLPGGGWFCFLRLGRTDTFCSIVAPSHWVRKAKPQAIRAAPPVTFLIVTK